MKAGDKVVITHNPHEGSRCEQIVGDVVEFKPKAAFMQGDLAHVRYYSPLAGKDVVLPFGMGNLEEMTPERAEALAERYRDEATRLMGLADELRRVDGI